MFRGLFAILLVATVFFSVNAQPPIPYGNRTRAPGTVIALQNPYIWADSVNCASADYNVPDSVIVCELRVTDSCLINLKLRNCSSIQLRAAANDIFRLDVLTVYKNGTDSLMRFGNKIRIFGITD